MFKAHPPDSPARREKFVAVRAHSGTLCLRFVEAEARGISISQASPPLEMSSHKQPWRRRRGKSDGTCGKKPQEKEKSLGRRRSSPADPGPFQVTGNHEKPEEEEDSYKPSHRRPRSIHRKSLPRRIEEE